MATPNCSTLIVGMATANCNGLTKPGGARGSVYIGLRSDIATLTVGTDGEITALTLTGGKYLYKFTSEKFVHEFTAQAVPKGHAPTMFKHAAKVTFFPYDDDEFNSLQSVLKSRRMFLIYANETGQWKTMGLDVNPYVVDIDDERGLMVVGGDITEGVKFEDRGSLTAQLEGEFYDIPKQYKPASDYATNLAALDALLPA